MVITPDFQSGDESSILSICSKQPSQSSEWYLYDSVDKSQGSESQSCDCRFESYTDYN